MKVFKFLEDDGANIEERLTKTEANTDGPADRAFAEVKKEFGLIKSHITKVGLLTQNLEDTNGIEGLIKDLGEKKKAVEDDVDTMLNLHVDEPGFEPPFNKLVVDFQTYRQFCSESFFPAIKDKLTEGELEHIEQQFDQVA